MSMFRWFVRLRERVHVFSLAPAAHALRFLSLFGFLFLSAAYQAPPRSPHENHARLSSSFFVTVDGSNLGDGTTSHPWSLSTALIQPGIVKPGDTIWIRGGRYRGEFTSQLSGNAELPVVLRQYPGERAIIDGSLSISGHHAYYWGFEITYSARSRITALSGSSPSDLPGLRMTVFVSGAFNKLINLVIHDLSDGLFAGSSAEGLEVYGCIFYNNGWVGPDRGHGHNVYLQNEGATKKVLDNILFDSFSSGLQIYGSSAARLRNFLIEGNTIFESGAPVAGRFGRSFDIEHWGGAPGSVANSIYRNNSIYNRDGAGTVVRLNAVGEPPGEGFEFSGNIVHGETNFNEMKNYIVTGNKFTTGDRRLAGQVVLIGLRFPAGVSYSANKWDYNSYVTPAGGTQDPFYVVGPSTAVLKFREWQSATGYDKHSTFVYGRFRNADIVVRANRYEAGRAFITCWNWDRAKELNVDLSKVLKRGDRFEIRHVFAIFDRPLIAGIFTGGPVRIPQPALDPPVPSGFGKGASTNTNEFNVFLLQKR